MSHGSALHVGHGHAGFLTFCLAILAFRYLPHALIVLAIIVAVKRLLPYGKEH